MNDILSTLNPVKEGSKFICCIEYSIATNDMGLCSLKSDATSQEVDIYSTHLDKSKETLKTVFKGYSAQFVSLLDVLLNNYSILCIDAIDSLLKYPNGKLFESRFHSSVLLHLLSDSYSKVFPSIIICCPIELTTEHTLSILHDRCNCCINVSQSSAMITLTKPSGKVTRQEYGLKIENSECIWSSVKDVQEDEENSTSTAQTYAASLNIMQTTLNAAPELIMEEDERDEDGDDDDDDLDADLNFYTVYLTNTIRTHFKPYSFALATVKLSIVDAIHIKILLYK